MGSSTNQILAAVAAWVAVAGCGARSGLLAGAGRTAEDSGVPDTAPPVSDPGAVDGGPDETERADGTEDATLGASNDAAVRDATSGNSSDAAVGDTASGDAGDSRVRDAGPADSGGAGPARDSSPDALPDAGCTASACGKRVFVTSQAYDGNMGGLDGGDQKCQALADAAGVTGTYRAWLADGTGSPATRFVRSSVPYYRIDGTLVANDWADLVGGTLRAGIDQTETGGSPPSSTVCGYPTAWTGAQPDGTPYPAGAEDCANWTTGANYPSPGGLMGRTGATDFQWTEACGVGGCGVVAPIYCFEQ